MSIRRIPAAHVIAASKGAGVVAFVGEREIGEVMARALDPFGVDDPCGFSPTNVHYGIGSCGEVACCYCGRVFWK